MITNTKTDQTYAGDGVQTVFGYNFKVFNSGDLKAYVGGVLTNVTVSNVGNDNGGNVTFLVAPANGSEILFKRVTPLTQTTNYQPNTKFKVQSQEIALDYAMAIMQEISRDLSQNSNSHMGNADEIELLKEEVATNTESAETNTGDIATNAGQISNSLSLISSLQKKYNPDGTLKDVNIASTITRDTELQAVKNALTKQIQDLTGEPSLDDYTILDDVGYASEQPFQNGITNDVYGKEGFWFRNSQFPQTVANSFGLEIEVLLGSPSQKFLSEQTQNYNAGNNEILIIKADVIGNAGTNLSQFGFVCTSFNGLATGGVGDDSYIHFYFTGYFYDIKGELGNEYETLKYNLSMFEVLQLKDTQTAINQAAIATEVSNRVAGDESLQTQLDNFEDTSLEQVLEVDGDYNWGVESSHTATIVPDNTFIFVATAPNFSSTTGIDFGNSAAGNPAEYAFWVEAKADYAEDRNPYKVVVKFANSDRTKSFEYHMDSFESGTNPVTDGSYDNYTFLTNGNIINIEGSSPGQTEKFNLTFFKIVSSIDDTPAEIKAKLESLAGNDRLSATAIKDLPAELAAGDNLVIEQNRIGLDQTTQNQIAANTAKTGITQAQTTAITANTAKTGITQAQASAITANTAKTGITPQQAADILTNNAKGSGGLTTAQENAIVANTAKTGITDEQTTNIQHNTELMEEIEETFFVTPITENTITGNPTIGVSATSPIPSVSLNISDVSDYKNTTMISITTDAQYWFSYNADLLAAIAKAEAHQAHTGYSLSLVFTNSNGDGFTFNTTGNVDDQTDDTIPYVRYNGTIGGSEGTISDLSAGQWSLTFELTTIGLSDIPAAIATNKAAIGYNTEKVGVTADNILTDGQVIQTKTIIHDPIITGIASNTAETLAFENNFQCKRANSKVLITFNCVTVGFNNYVNLFFQLKTNAGGGNGFVDVVPVSNPDGNNYGMGYNYSTLKGDINFQALYQVDNTDSNQYNIYLSKQGGAAITTTVNAANPYGIYLNSISSSFRNAIYTGSGALIEIGGFAMAQLSLSTVKRAKFPTTVTFQEIYQEV